MKDNVFKTNYRTYKSNKLETWFLNLFISVYDLIVLNNLLIQLKIKNLMILFF